MAIMNMLPMGGAGIKGSKVFAWFEDGEVDASETMGGIEAVAEANAETNISTMEADGFFYMHKRSNSYGRTVAFTSNYLPKNEYDYVLMHVIMLNSTVANQYFTIGGKTAKDNALPSVGAINLGNVTASDVWFTYSLMGYNAQNGNHYFGFGGTIDFKVDKIYFVKIRS